MEILDKKLKNGVNLRILNSPSFASSKITVKFNAGYLSVPREKNQIPHILEHIIWDYGKEAKLKFAEYGVWQNASTWDGQTLYWLECLPEFTDEMFSLILDKISSPEISLEKFEREIKNIETELATERTEPQQLLFETIKDEIFENIINEQAKKETLKNIKFSEIVDFYDKFYKTDNARIFIYGNFDDRAISKIINLIENWKLPRGEEFEIEKIRHKKTGLSKIKKDGENVYFQHLSHLGSFSMRQKVASGIIYRFLTHEESGNAYKELRDKGLLYGIYSGFWELDDLSVVFEINFSALDKNYRQVVSVLDKWVSKLKAGDFSQEELDFLRTTYKNGWRMDNKDFSDKADFLEVVFLSRDDFSEEDFLNELDKVTKQDVVELANLAFEHFDEGGWR